MPILDISIIALSVAACAILWAPAWFHLNRVKFIAQIISFPLALAVLGLLGVIASGILLVATGYPLWAAELLIFTIYTVAAAVKFSRQGTSAKPVKDDGAELVILGWNLLGDSVPAKTLRDAILKYSPDMVGLPEATEAYVNEVAALLRDAGYPMHGYNVGPKDGHDPHETAMLIKATHGDYTTSRVNVLGASTLVATPAVATSPTFVAVHTVAPTFNRHRGWVEDLLRLALRYRGAKNTVLVGDFNATAEHMMGLGTTQDGLLGNLVDAAAQMRTAAFGTWPVGKPARFGTQIDHVLHSPDYVTTGFEVLTDLDGSGSDHRAILASLSTTGA